MIVSDDRLQKALVYLAETDEPFANACAYVSALEKQEKIVLSQEFLKATGTVGERDAKARTSQAYQEWFEKYESAVAERDTLKAKRSTEDGIREVWRSLNASRRQGL